MPFSSAVEKSLSKRFLTNWEAAASLLPACPQKLPHQMSLLHTPPLVSSGLPVATRTARSLTTRRSSRWAQGAASEDSAAWSASARTGASTSQSARWCEGRFLKIGLGVLQYCGISNRSEICPESGFTVYTIINTQDFHLFFCCSYMCTFPAIFPIFSLIQ